jgi:acetyltransferase-like isoleucine patch superfamily enzyme
MIVPANHRFAKRDVPIRRQGVSANGIKVGSNVWLAAQCIVLDGSDIGDGCVVGAGAIVNGRLPENSVSVGVPSRVVKYR